MNDDNKPLDSNEERVVAITTIDNPYDPIDEFDDWYRFDVDNGYNTSQSIARLSSLRTDLSSNEIDSDNEQAIDRLIEIDPLMIYKKIVKIVKKT